MVAAHPKRFIKFALPIFIGFLAILVGQSTVAPPANAAIYGTIYNVAPKVSGGSSYGEGACAADQVVVGLMMGWNPMSVGFKCNVLNSDLTISPIASKTANYAYCPDGMVAVGMAFIDSNGRRAGLICNTPPGLSGADVETKYVSVINSPVLIDKPVGQAYLGGGVMRCNAGDIMVGWRVWSGAWLDGLAPRCAPFTKFTVTYNVNSGGGTAPATQQQSGPNASITLSSAYSGTRAGFTLSGWNTQANGLGTNYAAGASITPTANVILYAKWTSTITYNGNTNTSGAVPTSTTAVSSAAITKLAQNDGSSVSPNVPLTKTGFTFAGWNTAANGGGTAYSGYGYATPLLRYVATDYDTSTKVWTNSGSAGSSKNIDSTNMGSGTGITKISTTANVGGSNLSFTTLNGTTAARVTFPNAALSNYTLCHVSRYSGATKQRIFTHPTVNWLSGYLSGQSGYYNGVSNNGTVGLLTGDTNWHLFCDYNLNFRNNGTAAAASGRTSLPANIGISTWSGQASDWEVAEVLFYDEALDATQIQKVEESLASTYGLSGYTTGSGTYASTGNVTLYAQWNSTITYDGNGQTSAGSTVPAATIAKGTAANTTLANAGTMARSNYSFAGWNTQSDGLGTNYTSGLTTYQSAGNTTLYAKWTRTITYNSNGANSGTPERATDIFVNSTTPTISTFPTVGTMAKTGYTFAGWSTTTSGVALTTPYATTGEIPLYARWTANTYSVTYDTATVTSGTMANTSLTAGTAFSLRGNAFQRDGFSFKNWNTNLNGSGTTYTNSQSITLYSDLTLYPQWTLLAPSVGTLAATAGNTEVTLTPTPGAASATVGATTSVTITAYTSQSTTSVFNPSKTCTVVAPATSCVITGLTNGTIYYFKSVATNATGSSTLSGYTPGTPAGVVVTYNASANSGIIGTTGSTGTSTATFNKGTPLVLSTATRSGYVFSGWYTTQSSGGALVGAAGATYSPTTAITLYARFSGIVYTINYNGNGNTGGVVPSTGTYETGSDGSYNNTQVYTYTGADETFAVPSDITGTKEILVEVWGAGGAGTVYYYGLDYGGGAGGYTKATISTPTAGETLTIKVGKGGAVETTSSAYGGGGAGGNTSGRLGSSGGGYSGVFTGSTPLAISGGGGGASPGHSPSGLAGGGGGANQSGGASTDSTMSGRGGTTSAGGAKAASCASDGAQYTGGAACGAGAEGGGGGGGGYYGGGGGNSSGQANGGGGGGSGFLSASRGSLITATVGENGAASTTWAFPNKTSANYGTTNAGRGGKSVTNTTADNSGGNGRIVIQWKTGSGAHVVGAAPEKAGYTFAGWTTNADGTGTTYQPNASITPSTNLSLFAKWTANTNTISYNANTGSGDVPTSGSYVSGAATSYTVLAKPAGLTKTGSDFIGWNTAANGSGTSYSAGAALTALANTVLYAQWSVSTYSYSYQLNGGTSAQPSSGTAAYNSVITLPSVPTRAGFTFAGWNDGSAIALNTTTVILTSNKIFVAQWTAQSFTVTFDGNNAFGGINTSGSVTSGTYISGGVPYAIAANGFAKVGYNFDGWKNSAGTSFVVGSGYSTPANLTLIAQWAPASYTITYNSNGATSGTAPSQATLTTGTTFSASSNSGTLVKTGYEFAGWNTSAAGTGTNIAVSGVVSTTTNLILYAKWTIISPTITFNDGVATAALLIFPTNTSAQYGSLYTLPSVDTATVISTTNHIFTGWSDGTATYNTGESYRMGNSNVIFTAQWVALFDVTYVYGNGTNADTKDPECITSSLCRNNQAITTTVAPSRAGYTFTHWIDQSGTTVAGNAAYTVSDGHYVLRAVWAAVPRTLSFTANSGEGSQSSLTNKYIGELVELPAATFTRTGYTFSGWLNNSVTYPAGGTFIVGDGDATFSAVWIGNANTIFYNGNGATGGTAPDNGSQATGSAYTVAANRSAPDTLVKTGFTFADWNTNANGTGVDYAAGATGLASTSNVTLYAKWTADSFAVTYITGAGASTAPTQANTMYGATFSLPSAPTKTGFDFIGWETGSDANATVYAPGSNFTMGASAITFTAKWSGLSYVVVYLLNGGAGTTPTQANVLHAEGFTTATAPARNGFTFSGWSDGADLRSAGASITNVTSNRTLTAQWTIAAPGTPGTPTAAPGNGSATITISAPSTGGTPSSYTVTASPGGATCTVTSPGTSCTIAPLSNGTAYTFTSTATNTTGTSTSASTESASVTPAGIPNSPTGVTGTGIGGTANITWTLPTSDGGSAITDYVIEYSVESSGTWTTFADGVSTATSATITGLTAGNAYEFRVSTKNIIGNSLPSFTSPVVEALPTAPTITGTTPASGQVTVVWSAPTHLGSGTITQYTITAYGLNGNVAGSCNPDPGQTTCVVSGLDNGSPYTFKAAVTTTVGDSIQSSATASVIPSGVPSSPSDVAAVTSGSNMSITFTAPADNGGAAITSYVVTSSPAGATCTVGANATTYTCTGLTAGTNYSYTVKAVNVRGQSSESLASTAVTAVAAPSAPQNVSAVITAGSTTLSATVSFDPPATENGSAVTSYTVTASPGGATCTVSAPTLFCDIPVLPDQVYTFSVRAINAVGTSAASASTLEIKATNGIAPTLVVDPAAAPSGTLTQGSTLTSLAEYTATPNAVITYVWKRCTSQFDDTTCSTISGATSATYVTTANDAEKFIRVETTGTNSIGFSTKLSDATEAIVPAPVAPTPTTPTAPTTPSVSEPEPAPVETTCNAACQAIKDAAATKAAADAASKAAADKAAAEAAAKLKADAAATTASTKASADATAAAAAAKAAIDKAAAAAIAQAAADAAAKTAAAQAKAASDAQTAATKAAADAAAALKNSTTTAAAKAAATKTASNAAAAATAAVKAAATAASDAAKAKTTAANATKQVDIAINSLNSKTAASQASAAANAVAAAAKAAANEAAAAAATKASEAKAVATSAQKAASETAARIATEQKQAADAAALAKIAADAAVKATAEKVAAVAAATKASQDLATVLAEKATLAEQAAKATDQAVRSEIQKKIDEVTTKVEEVQKTVEAATTKADAAVAVQATAVQTAETATKEATTQAAEAVAVKAESVTKTAEATKAVAAATVAAKVALAAKAAAAKVPSKATIIPKASTSTNKNSAKATVTGLKPGQKVKVTVNVKGK